MYKYLKGALIGLKRLIWGFKATGLTVIIGIVVILVGLLAIYRSYKHKYKACDLFENTDANELDDEEKHILQEDSFRYTLKSS